MGIFDFLKGGHMDEQDDGYTEHADDPYWSEEDSDEDNLWIGPLAKRRDEECAANDTPYGHGQAEARFRIDDLRRYYKQYGSPSFREGVEGFGKYALQCLAWERERVASGETDRQQWVEFHQGELSIYD